MSPVPNLSMVKRFWIMRGIAIFALAIDQARAALSEQRTVLLLRPEGVQTHRMLPAPPGQQAAPTPPRAANA